MAMTSGERRGLIALTVVLALIVVFAICRDTLFSPRAGLSLGSRTEVDSVGGASSVDALSADSVYLPDSVSEKSGKKVVRSRDKSGRTRAKSVRRRDPLPRDPLSQPVN